MDIESFVSAVKEVIALKDTIEPKDTALVVLEESEGPLYAYVKAIERDSTRKDEWWHVSLAFLTFPPQNIIWTLRTSQMTGMEIFTMGGKKRFIKALDFSISPPAKSSGRKKKGVLKRVK